MPGPLVSDTTALSTVSNDCPASIFLEIFYKHKDDVTSGSIVAQLAQWLLPTRGPRFESSHRQKFVLNIFTLNCIEKTKIMQKWLGLAHF